MTCYTIKAEDQKTYEQLAKLLRGRVTIFASNEKTFSLSVSEPSHELIDALQKLGADVAIDYHYEFE